MDQLFKLLYIKSTFSALAVLFCVAVTQNCCFAGGFYSFTDKNGVIHFSNAPSDPRYYSVGKKQAAPDHKPAIRLKTPDISRSIADAAGYHGLDPALVKAIIEVESGGRLDARSSKGAVGLMQLMPATAAEMGVKDRTDCTQNIKGGTGYFSRLLEQFHGDIVLALAAYNAGPSAVEKYHGLPPYLETVRYVRKVLEAWNRYRTCRSYKSFDHNRHRY